MRGTFQNCGQNCIGLERLVVHEKIYDKFVADMATRVRALTQGPPAQGVFDCGAMTMGEQQVRFLLDSFFVFLVVRTQLWLDCGTGSEYCITH